MHRLEYTHLDWMMIHAWSGQITVKENICIKMDFHLFALNLLHHSALWHVSVFQTGGQQRSFGQQMNTCIGAIYSCLWPWCRWSGWLVDCKPVNDAWIWLLLDCNTYYSFGLFIHHSGCWLNWMTALCVCVCVWMNANNMPIKWIKPLCISSPNTHSLGGVGQNQKSSQKAFDNRKQPYWYYWYDCELLFFQSEKKRIKHCLYECVCVWVWLPAMDGWNKSDHSQHSVTAFLHSINKNQQPTK